MQTSINNIQLFLQFRGFCSVAGNHGSSEAKHLGTIDGAHAFDQPYIRTQKKQKRVRELARDRLKHAQELQAIESKALGFGALGLQGFRVL